jgi:hypothetical protein
MDDHFPALSDSADRQKLMDSLGITHVLTDVFHYRDYRYGKLEDAVAQARRDQAALPV